MMKPTSRQFAAFSKVSVNSQTVIPREVCEQLKLKPGDTLRFRLTDDGVLLDKATNASLKAGLKNHLEETGKQIERLESAFAKLGQQPKGATCPAIDGIIKEADETAGEIADKTVLDVAIVANAQAVEHYEMTRYGTLIAWAEELGHDDVVRFLTTNLNEEKAANTKLNTLATRKGINSKGAAAA